MQHTEATLRELAEKISVCVMWKESCLLPMISLRQLQGTNMHAEAQRSSSPAFSLRCVIPQADLEEEEGGGGEEGREGTNEGTVAEWSVTDIEASDPHMQNTYQEDLSVVREELSIRFHSNDPDAIKVSLDHWEGT